MLGPLVKPVTGYWLAVVTAAAEEYTRYGNSAVTTIKLFRVDCRYRTYVYGVLACQHHRIVGERQNADSFDLLANKFIWRRLRYMMYY